MRREREKEAAAGLLVAPAPMQGLRDRTSGREEVSGDVKAWEHL